MCPNAPGYLAIGWLLEACKRGKKAVRKAEREAAADHEEAHLADYVAKLRHRLEQLCSCSQVEAAEKRVAGRGQRAERSKRAAEVVPPAAQECKRRHVERRLT